eukprot:8972532-Pyramimonas_sp.AAC.1
MQWIWVGDPHSRNTCMDKDHNSFSLGRYSPKDSWKRPARNSKSHPPPSLALTHILQTTHPPSYDIQRTTYHILRTMYYIRIALPTILHTTYHVLHTTNVVRRRPGGDGERGIGETKKGKGEG